MATTSTTRNADDAPSPALLSVVATRPSPTWLATECRRVVLAAGSGDVSLIDAEVTLDGLHVAARAAGIRLGTTSRIVAEACASLDSMGAGVSL